MSRSETSIESSNFPLVFHAGTSSLNLDSSPCTDNHSWIRTLAHPLAGMQKEALVHSAAGGTIWRIVCDEGAWLNGTDLAPFPLAFFTAGLSASFMSAFLEEARSREIRVDSVELELDNFFTMEGSALRGTMAASAQPVQVIFSARGNASDTEFAEIAEYAVRFRSPAERCLGQALVSGFAVRANNAELPWPGAPANRVAALTDPARNFAMVRPALSEDINIIGKIAGPEKCDSDPVGLKADQKRKVQVHTKCTNRKDGLKSIHVQCIRPAGSCFELLSDNSPAAGGLGRAPSGLVYLSTGVAFCFMTQIGRYAQITKQKLNSYRIIQDTGFRLAGDCETDAAAVQTLVCLDTRETRDKSRQLVRMAEQTCYLHAAFRTAAGSQVKFQTS